MFNVIGVCMVFLSLFPACFLTPLQERLQFTEGEFGFFVIVAWGAVMGVWDFLLRWKRGGKNMTGAETGGRFFFFPVWILGCLLATLGGLVVFFTIVLPRL